MEREKEIRLSGFPICTGIAIGRPFFFFDVDEKIPEVKVKKGEVENEVARFWRALKNSEKDLKVLQKRLLKEGGSESAAILSSHLEIMKDPEITSRIEDEIRSKRKNSEYVFKSVVREYEQKFNKISNLFFRERVSDFQGISRRIMSHLRSNERPKLSQLTSKVIVFADELSPSDTAEANSEFIEAIVTRSGSETSHVAIMAREKGIPFVSNVSFSDYKEIDSLVVIVDGRSGHVILNPSTTTLSNFREEKKRLSIHVQGLMMGSQLKAETQDAYNVKVTANLERLDEVENLLMNGGEGVGLFRSEYLFLAKDRFPTEEEQFIVYKSLVERICGLPVIIRTFDIGGDKIGQFHPTRYERNPYLGCRAIRLMLKEKAAFKAQLRAILRASAFGDVGLLFPMISHLKELHEALEVLDEAKAELSALKIPFSRNLSVGCMVEVPSAALMADQLAAACDFLSIGTNDLVQYTVAVDRTDPALSYLYTAAHPSVLRLIQMTIEAAHRRQIPVSVCGEIAADPKYTPLLVGMGINELSVAVPSIALIKNSIRQLSFVEQVDFAEEILNLTSAEAVLRRLNEFYQARLI